MRRPALFTTLLFCFLVSSCRNDVVGLEGGYVFGRIPNLQFIEDARGNTIVEATDRKLMFAQYRHFIIGGSFTVMERRDPDSTFFVIDTSTNKHSLELTYYEYLSYLQAQGIPDMTLNSP